MFDTCGQPSVDHEEGGGGPSVAGGAEAQLRPLLTLDRHHTRDAHRFLVSCVCWYPMDTGLFLTGSLDQTIKVWDANW